MQSSEVLRQLIAFSPLLIATITGIAGLTTYLIQKKTERRHSLINLRQVEYRRYLQRYFATLSDDTSFDGEAINNSLMDMYILASDAVIEALGRLNRYVVETSFGRKPRDMRVMGLMIAESIKAMRQDCYEAGNITSDQLKALLPIQGVVTNLDDDGNPLGGNTRIRPPEEMGSDAQLAPVRKLLDEIDEIITRRYKALLEEDNAPDDNTAKIAVCMFAGRTLSTLPTDQIAYMRETGVIAF